MSVVLVVPSLLPRERAGRDLVGQWVVALSVGSVARCMAQSRAITRQLERTDSQLVFELIPLSS